MTTYHITDERNECMLHGQIYTRCFVSKIGICRFYHGIETTAALGVRIIVANVKPTAEISMLLLKGEFSTIAAEDISLPIIRRLLDTLYD